MPANIGGNNSRYGIQGGVPNFRAHLPSQVSMTLGCKVNSYDQSLLLSKYVVLFLWPRGACWR
jgi:hypothetical protein